MGSLLFSIKNFFKGTLLSRITGLLRDVATAYAFGATADIAAFMIAFRLVNLPRRLLAEGALQTAFIPEYESKKQRSLQEAAHLFLDVTLLLTLSLTVATLLLLGGGLPFLANPIVTLSLLMLPSLFFVSWYGMTAAVLQCEGCFFIPSAAPVAFNLVFALSALYLMPLGPEKGSFWLAVLVNVAFFAQFVVTLPALCKRLLSVCSSWRPRLHRSSAEKLLAPFLLSLGGVASQQINSAIDPLFARFADPSGPAYLWYAIRIEQLPLALFGVSVASALLPALSRAITKSDHQRADALFSSAIRITLLLMIPLSGLIFLFGAEGVRLIFERGDFLSHDSQETTWCLWGYALGLIPSALVLLVAPLFYATGDYKTPMRASLASVICNLLLNTLFVFGFSLGSPSIAVATSISITLNFVLLRQAMKPEALSHLSWTSSLEGLKALSAGALFTLPALFFFGHASSFKLYFGYSLEKAPDLMTQVGEIACYGALFLLGALVNFRKRHRVQQH